MHRDILVRENATRELKVQDDCLRPEACQQNALQRRLRGTCGLPYCEVKLMVRQLTQMQLCLLRSAPDNIACGHIREDVLRAQSTS
jgi:hypothetical protein